MSKNIIKRKIAAPAQKKASLKHKNKRNLARLEDSKNLNDLGRIAAIGTSSAHKRALKIFDGVVYVDEGQIIRHVKGRKPQIIKHISPRRATKGEVLIIHRERV